MYKRVSRSAAVIAAVVGCGACVVGWVFGFCAASAAGRTKAPVRARRCFTVVSEKEGGRATGGQGGRPASSEWRVVHCQLPLITHHSELLVRWFDCSFYALKSAPADL